MKSISAAAAADTLLTEAVSTESNRYRATAAATDPVKRQYYVLAATASIERTVIIAILFNTLRRVNTLLLLTIK